MARGSIRSPGLPSDIVVNPAAVLPSPPPTLPIWGKVLYWLAETVAVSSAWKLFDSGAEFLGVGSEPTGTEADSWRRFAFHWSNSASLEASDDMYFTVDLANITAGQLDGTWTDNDFNMVLPYLIQLAQQIAPNVASHLTCTEIRAYIMAFNDYSNPKPFAQSGAPEWIQTLNATGGLAQPAGPQICSTVTEQTPSRRHWGRFYTPSLGANALVGGGRVGRACVDAYANATHTCYEALMANQFFPVVPVTQVDKVPVRALQTVTGIRVDDVPDVQRSRRPKLASYHNIQPVAAATRPADNV